MKNALNGDEARQRRASRQDEMALLSSDVARLAQRLAELTTEESGASSETSTGMRVRTMRKDECHLRVGTVGRIRSWKGCFWCVKLDATETTKATEIWKKEKYLETVRDEEEEDDADVE